MTDENSTRRVDVDDYDTRIGLKAGVEVFGRYRLDALAGRGGMGVVWKARDEKLERLVALKFLPAVVAGDAEAVRDLLRETKRCLDLTHPNIVRVHDFVQDGPMAAISMEYVDGESLAKRKVASPIGCMTLQELRPLAEQLCAALDYAHQVAKIIHRDLKPANVLVTNDGRLKVTDFGIARSLSDTHTRLTGRVDNTSGTLRYMSPQQLRGADPAVSDDIYALGVTLYELLTGKPPFHTGDVPWQIREEVPKPVNARRAALGIDPVSAEWEETIQACLAKEPKNRPQMAAEVAGRLGIVGDRASGQPVGDSAEAARWYRKAADQGDAEGQWRLGRMYETGEGVPKDSAEAIKWFRKAADQGDADMQSMLGWRYAFGDGVAKDETEALARYYTAATLGDDIAAKRRDALKHRLGRAASLAAQRRSKELLKEIETAKNKNH